MDAALLAQKLKGTHTIETAAKALDVSQKTAINYLSELRKQNYVRTKYLRNKRRIYLIGSYPPPGGTSYTDILNEHSPVKLAASTSYRIYGREVPVEETLVYAVKTQQVRTILASLALFKKITDWQLLWSLSRKNNVVRQVNALYDVARTVMRVRKANRPFRLAAKPQVQDEFAWVIQDLQSKDFTNIEQKWRVRIPFNKSDLEAYK